MPRTEPVRMLLDTNIWLGYFLKSGPAYADIAVLLERGALGHADLLFTPGSIKDVFYLLPREFRRADEAEGVHNPASYEPAAWACIEWMLELFTASPLSAFECRLAAKLRGDFHDYEDDLMIASAESAKVDYIVTLDGPLLKRFPEICIDPARALRAMEAWPRPKDAEGQKR